MAIFVLNTRIMTAIELKNNFHHLIDSIDNENLLQQFYELMLRKRGLKDGKLWNNLSKDEIEELLLANEESENPDNLIFHDDAKKKYAEWL
jgi:hypothetical protein